MPEKGWRRRFDDPIQLPRGQNLVTLEDAGKYITQLPSPSMRGGVASGALILVATLGGPTMFARIGVMRSLALAKRVERIVVRPTNRPTLKSILVSSSRLVPLFETASHFRRAKGQFGAHRKETGPKPYKECFLANADERPVSCLMFRVTVPSRFTVPRRHGATGRERSRGCQSA
jgi:hypothetical protein